MRLFLCLLLAVPMLAQPQPRTFTISLLRGHSGGTSEVTISGNFQWQQFQYRVLFGSSEAQLVSGSDQQLVVRTPAHLPARVPVTIFEGTTPIDTGLTFTFEGDTIQFERILLPVFVNLQGAFGSEFRTDLTASITGTSTVEIFGLEPPCHLSACIPSRSDRRTVRADARRAGPRAGAGRGDRQPRPLRVRPERSVGRAGDEPPRVRHVARE